ncbi:hypothetical protein [Polaribacter sp. R77954]|uniref:hypothetical protein n=1 Tax=Polaribacter sp. R77954 TaxID=3093870 RepID=UPI0037C9808C
MIDLKEIIHSFSKEKQQEFIGYLAKKNKRKDAKNIQLVKLLTSDNLSSKDICYVLYKKDNKVALHALRKRLFQSLIDFTANSNIKEEHSVDMQMIKYILSARTFLQKGNYLVGYKILDKAEIIAKEYQLYSILNEIYHTKIEYAHHFKSINIDELVSQFKNNQKQHQIEESFNIAYAKIRKTLNEINHQKKVIDLKTIIADTLQEDAIAFSELSFKSLYQIIQITNISSSQNFDYWNIESFLLETYKILKQHVSKEKQLYYHIEVLYVISNTLFRNKKFLKALHYLELMNLYMHKKNKKYFKEFETKYTLLLALNYNYIGNQYFAINILQPFVAQNKAKTVEQLDIYLCLIVFYAQQKQTQKSSTLLAKLYRTDQWYIEKAGIIWTIKKNIIEILIQLDLGNVNLIESRLKSFKRNYFKHLKEIHQENVIAYIQLIEIYFKNPEIVTSKKFYEKVESALNWVEKDKEDIFMMSFYAWLKAKMTKKDMYEVTLNLVQSTEGF